LYQDCLRAFGVGGAECLSNIFLCPDEYVFRKYLGSQVTNFLEIQVELMNFQGISLKLTEDFLRLVLDEEP
jgi:hypothetical protein